MHNRAGLTSNTVTTFLVSFFVFFFCSQVLVIDCRAWVVFIIMNSFAVHLPCFCSRSIPRLLTQKPPQWQQYLLREMITLLFDCGTENHAYAMLKAHQKYAHGILCEQHNSVQSYAQTFTYIHLPCGCMRWLGRRLLSSTVVRLAH